MKKITFVLVLLITSLILLIGCQPAVEPVAPVNNEAPPILEKEKAVIPASPAEEVKYSALISLDISKRIHRLPWIQRTGSQADEYTFEGGINVQLYDLNGNPLERAVIQLDGKIIEPWPEMPGFYKMDYLIGESAFAPGKHALNVAVNDKLVGTYNFTIIGLTLTEPIHGAQNVAPLGFDVKWTEENVLSGVNYRFASWSALTSDSMCAGHSSMIPNYDKVVEKTIHLTSNPEVEEAIKSGDYAISIEAGLYSSFQTNRETIFTFTYTETDAHDIIVGQTNPAYCCNPFEPRC